MGVTPSYSVLEEEGPDHEKHFTVGIFLRDELVARGEGESKQEAEQEAGAQRSSGKRVERPRYCVIFSPSRRGFSFC